MPSELLRLHQTFLCLASFQYMHSKTILALFSWQRDKKNKESVSWVVSFVDVPMPHILKALKVQMSKQVQGKLLILNPKRPLFSYPNIKKGIERSHKPESTYWQSLGFSFGIEPKPK